MNKFAEYYKAANLKSVSWLASFLFDLNHNLDLIINIKSNFMICVQVKSVKQHKMKGSECKQKLSTIKDKENLDS